MRTRHSFLFIALVAVAALQLAACGDDGGTSFDAAPDGFTGFDAGPVDDGGDVVDGSSTDDGGGTDAGPTVDGGGTVGITCGKEVCTGDQECCVSGGGAQACVATGTCEGVALACDDAADCSGADEVCCFGAGGGSACAPADDCPTPTCVTVDDCPNPNQECCPIGDWSICAPQCPGA